MLTSMVAILGAALVLISVVWWLSGLLADAAGPEEDEVPE